MKSWNHDNRLKLTISIIGVSVATLLTAEARAATCPCDLTIIPETAWAIDAKTQTFDAIEIDTGLICTDIKDTKTDARRFELFKRLVGTNLSTTSRSMIELRIKRDSRDTSCTATVDNSGSFDSSQNIQYFLDALSDEEFEACIAAGTKYAQRLGFSCQTTVR